MLNLTIPESIFLGLFFIAISIASLPYSFEINKPAFASSKITKIAICNETGYNCVSVKNKKFVITDN